jgi:hypothetical protein
MGLKSVGVEGNSPTTEKARRAGQLRGHWSLAASKGYQEGQRSFYASEPVFSEWQPIQQHISHLLSCQSSEGNTEM